MHINVTKAHKVTFCVEYFEATEGGMDNEMYGGQVNTIEEAISLLELAQVSDPKSDWMITARVTTTIKGEGR